jgi:hypothetical protein
MGCGNENAKQKGNPRRLLGTGLGRMVKYGKNHLFAILLFSFSSLVILEFVGHGTTTPSWRVSCALEELARPFPRDFRVLSSHILRPV